MVEFGTAPSLYRGSYEHAAPKALSCDIKRAAHIMELDSAHLDLEGHL